MKKTKFIALGLIAALMVGGLALVSCRAGCEGNGNCKIKDKEGTACTNMDCAVFKAAMKNEDGKCDC